MCSPRSSRQRPRTPEEIDAVIARLSALNRSPPREVRWVADETRIDAGVGFKLYAGAAAIDSAGRAELLAKLAAGEKLPPVEIEIVAYIQRDTPNRNFVRFKNSALSGLAKSFKGQPFLKDHNDYDVLSRGGTVVSAKLEKSEDASEITMRVSLVKDWAIEGVLDGTIDRFSIGWCRTGPVECSIHKTPVFTECDCWPGDKIGDKVVEFVFTSAEGTEVSAVNVPAVVGTGIQTIGQLAALDRTVAKDILGVATNPDKKEHQMTIDPKIFAALGLAPTDQLADVLAAIGQIKDEGTLLSASKAALTTELATLRSTEKERAAKERLVVVEAAVSQLAHAGKLRPGSDVEQALRRMADRDMEMFASQVKDMLATGTPVTPVGRPPVAAGPDPVAAAPTLGAPLTGKDYLTANPGAAKWLNKAGITQDQFEKHGAGARATIAENEAARR